MNKKDPLRFQDCAGLINFDKSKRVVYLSTMSDINNVQMSVFN